MHVQVVAAFRGDARGLPYESDAQRTKDIRNRPCFVLRKEKLMRVERRRPGQRPGSPPKACRDPQAPRAAGRKHSGPSRRLGEGPRTRRQRIALPTHAPRDRVSAGNSRRSPCHGGVQVARVTEGSSPSGSNDTQAASAPAPYVENHPCFLDSRLLRRGRRPGRAWCVLLLRRPSSQETDGGQRRHPYATRKRHQCHQCHQCHRWA